MKKVLLLPLICGLVIIAYTLWPKSKAITEDLARSAHISHEHTQLQPSAPLKNEEEESTAMIPQSKRDVDQLTALVNQALSESISISQYPVSSHPLSSDSAVQQFSSKTQPSTTLSYPLQASLSETLNRESQDVASPAHFSIQQQVERYQYFMDEDIAFTLTLGDLARVNEVLVISRLKSALDGEVLLSLEEQYVSLPQTLQARFSTAEREVQEWPLELLLESTIHIEGEQVIVNTPLRYSASVADLKRVSSYVDDEGLRLTLHFSVQDAGYYFVYANLYDAQGELALVHLETEGRMSQGEASLEMLAQRQALGVSLALEAYRLKDITITRMGGQGVPDMFGRSQEAHFDLSNE